MHAALLPDPLSAEHVKSGVAEGSLTSTMTWLSSAKLRTSVPSPGYLANASIVKSVRYLLT